MLWDVGEWNWIETENLSSWIMLDTYILTPNLELTNVISQTHDTCLELVWEKKWRAISFLKKNQSLRYIMLLRITCI